MPCTRSRPFCSGPASRLTDVGRDDPRDEALGILQEECSEVIKEASKIFRSGPDFCREGGTVSNKELLHIEIADVLIWISICEALGVIDMGSFDMPGYMVGKALRLKTYTSIPWDVIDKVVT